MRSVVALLSIFSLATACGPDKPLSPQEERQIDRARAQWTAAAVRNYDFEYRESCFCPVEITQWTRIEVRSDTVARVTPLTALVTQEMVDRYRHWPTIDGLFTRIRGTASGTWVHDVVMRFHATYGYPMEVTVVPKSNIADAGWAMSIRSFVVR